MSAQTVAQAIPAGTYAVDPVHSSVNFAVRHNGVATFRSGFRAYEARFTGGESPGLEGGVEVASIEIEDPQLRGHLLSPDFFDAERHPQLSFRSTSLEIAADGRAKIRGELEIRGAKHQVEAEGGVVPLGADLAGSPRVGLSFETSVDRRDFGLDWNAELPSGGEVLDWDVAIAVDLELVGEGE